MFHVVGRKLPKISYQIRVGIEDYIKCTDDDPTAQEIWDE